MYYPIKGRWLTRDPIGFEAGDANLFRYVGNDPPNFTDPDGLQEKDSKGFYAVADPKSGYSAMRPGFRGPIGRQVQQYALPISTLPSERKQWAGADGAFWAPIDWSLGTERTGIVLQHVTTKYFLFDGAGGELKSDMYTDWNYLEYWVADSTRPGKVDSPPFKLTDVFGRPTEIQKGVLGELDKADDNFGQFSVERATSGVIVQAATVYFFQN